MKRFSLQCIMLSLFILSTCSAKEEDQSTGKLLSATQVNTTINFLGY